MCGSVQRLKPFLPQCLGKLERIIRQPKSMSGRESGSAGVIFALALPALLGLIGGAVDYAAITKDQTRLQSAADATALSIAREMTLGPMTQDRVQALATSYSAANFGATVAAIGTLVENGMAVKVSLQKAAEVPLGILPMLAGVTDVAASATARVNANPSPTKLCVLSLGEKTNGGIFMHNNSVISAPECMLQSNSTVREAMIIQQGSQLTANLACARGGISNSAGVVRTTLLTDCPPINNPLANKPEPSTLGPCLANNLVVKGTERRTLSPGIYCNGVTIEGNAQVTLSPGVFVFRGGPLVVSQNGELLGNGVTLMFSGRKAYFRFLDNSLIRISAPTSGLSAGMLIWESSTFIKGLNSWQNGGCGGNGNDDDDDNGVLGCTTQVVGKILPKKTNEHHINSDRARELTGTIYLRDGLLLVDSRRPVADQSPFTVLVVNKLDLYDGPNLMLNSNYGGAAIPVPPGLGPIGSKNVRLGY